MRSSASSLDRRVGQRRRERSLQEAHAVVEQVEALEAVAHEVEVGLEAGDARAAGASAPRRGSGDGPEPVGDPHPAVGQLVGLEVGAHEDGAAAAAGAALDEVAGHVVGADRRRGSARGGRAGPGPSPCTAGTTRRPRSSGPAGPSRLAHEPAVRLLVVAHRVAQHPRVGLPSVLGAAREVLEAHLVLEVVLVEQRGLEQLRR